MAGALDATVPFSSGFIEMFSKYCGSRGSDLGGGDDVLPGYPVRVEAQDVNIKAIANKVKKFFTPEAKITISWCMASFIIS